MNPRIISSSPIPSMQQRLHKASTMKTLYALREEFLTYTMCKATTLRRWMRSYKTRLAELCRQEERVA